MPIKEKNPKNNVKRASKKPDLKGKGTKRRSKKSIKQRADPNVPILENIMQPGLNHLFFYEPVSRESVDELTRQLKSVQDHTGGSDLVYGTQVTGRPNAIVLHIHSYGGEVYAGLEALKAIEECQIPVLTVVDGIAASAATWLAVAGRRRYIGKNSHMLIHEVITSDSGEVKWKDVKTKYHSIKQLMKIIKRIYQDRTSLNPKELDKILERDLYWDAKQCKTKIGMTIL